jgi:hypothetical protein
MRLLFTSLGRIPRSTFGRNLALLATRWKISSPAAGRGCDVTVPGCKWFANGTSARLPAWCGCSLPATTAAQARYRCSDTRTALSCARRMPESGVFALPLELGTLEPQAAAAATDLSDSISALCNFYICAAALSADQVCVRCAFSARQSTSSVCPRGAQAHSSVTPLRAHFQGFGVLCTSKPKSFLASRGGRSQNPDDELGAADTSKSADRRVRASGTRQRWSRGFQKKRDLGDAGLD